MSDRVIIAHKDGRRYSVPEKKLDKFEGFEVLGPDDGTNYFAASDPTKVEETTVKDEEAEQKRLDQIPADEGGNKPNKPRRGK